MCHGRREVPVKQKTGNGRTLRQNNPGISKPTFAFERSDTTVSIGSRPHHVADTSEICLERKVEHIAPRYNLGLDNIPWQE